MLARFGTSSGGSGTTYNWPNLEPMQVALYLDGEITQVIDSLPWVRCASGNVFFYFHMKIVMFSCTGGISCKDEDIFIHGECIIGGLKFSNLWDIDNRVENYPNIMVKLN